MDSDYHNIIKYEFFKDNIINKCPEFINNQFVEDISFNWNISIKCSNCNEHGCIKYELENDTLVGWDNHYMCITCTMNLIAN